MLFKGNSSRLESLIEKIQANKENHDQTQDALGTEAGSSWGGGGQTSPGAASVASSSDVGSLASSGLVDLPPDAELSFTVGVTEATPYACQFCDKAFPRLSYLKKHEQTHSEHMPFRCEFCARLFKHKRSRDRHIKLHTGDKKYRCNQCDAAFSRSDHLKIHMKTHDNQKPFQCTVCNRGYNTAAALTSHMQNHKKGGNGESPPPAGATTTYKCLQCAELFARPDELQGHMATQHRVGSEGGGSPPPPRGSPASRRSHPRLSPATGRRLSCLYCTKDSFSTMEALQIHVQAMHGSLLNGGGNSELAGLFAGHPLLTPPHHRSSPHSLSLPYSCDLCTMRFHSVAALQKHALTVHGFRAKEAGSLFCVQCNLQFPSPALFAEHYVLFHGSAIGLFAPPPPDTAAQQVKPTDLSLTKKVSPRSNEDPQRPSKRPRNENGISANGLDSSRRTPTTYEHSGTLLCNQCNAALPDFESFRSHVKSHLDEVGGGMGLRGLLGGGSEPPAPPHRKSHPPPLCPHCGAQLASHDDLPAHIAGHLLSTAVEYGCPGCLKPFAQPDELQRHLLELHSAQLFRCSLCAELFDSKVAIQVHFAVKHSNETKLFRCTGCPGVAVYRSESDFGAHVRSVHLPPPPPPPRHSPNSPKLPLAAAQPPLFRCLFCRLSFGSELEMQLHLAAHAKQFRCRLCPDAAFHVEFLLDRHVQTHHATQQVFNGVDETEIGRGKMASSEQANKKQDSANNNHAAGAACDICERGDFASEAELAAHRKLVHHVKAAAGKVSLQCAYCSEQCKSRSDLESHTKSHSSGGCVSLHGKHKCNICDEMCTSVSALAEHKLTHCKVVAGTCCTHCKQGIGSEDQFYQHLRQHGNGSPELPAACVICRQTLVSDVEARIHARFHLAQSQPPAEVCVVCRSTPGVDGTCRECCRHGQGAVRCPHCQLKFETAPALDAHVNSVHRKPYQCIKCQVSFDTESEVQQHVASHLTSPGPEPAGRGTGTVGGVECRLCSRQLPSAVQLQTHLIEHTFAGCPTFTCYICSAVFTAASGLQSHMVSSHGPGARPYDCAHCPQRFYFRAELDHHSFAHTEKESPYYPYNGKNESTDLPVALTESSPDDAKRNHQSGDGESQPVKKEIKQERVEEEEGEGGREEEEEEEEEQIDVGDHSSDRESAT